MTHLAGVVSVVAFAAAGVLLVASSVLRELRAPRGSRGRRALTAAASAPALGLPVAVLLAASTAVALVATAVRLLTAVS